MNIVVLTGRLTRDPELSYTQSGVARATFTLAVDRSYTDDQGKRETDFINIVAWRQLAEVAATHLKKGQLLNLAGRIQTRNYENDNGQKVYITEVIAEEFKFGFANGNGNRNNENPFTTPPANYDPFSMPI